MFRKGIVLAALCAGLCLVPSTARAEFEEGDFELTLGGSGANGNDFDGVSFSVNGSIGYFITDWLEVALRQNVNYTDIGVDSALGGSTRVALDFHFDLDAFQPFIGANIGYVYGDIANDTFEAAPEAGIKLFLNSTTFAFLMAEYQFFFDTADEADDSFEDGQFLYTLGLGVKW